MRKIILIIVLFIVNYMNGQEEYFFPKVTSPTDEAISLIKANNVNFNEFKGSPNVSLPIYDIKIGNYIFPITLNYNSNGVRVNDISTWTGIGWVLNTNNVITRTVKDGPDEEFSQPMRPFFQLNDLEQMLSSNCTPVNNDYVYNIMGTDGIQYDTELDIFNFSIPNYSGQFYLDENFSPILVNSKKEHKIEIIGNLKDDKIVKITAPEGVIYTFGGNFTETTFSPTPVQNRVSGVTSFYLYEVEIPLKGKITFEYETLERSNYNLYNYSIVKIPLTDIYSHSPYIENDNYFGNTILNPKVLTKITNEVDNTEIIFNSIKNNTQAKNYLKVLENIEIKKKSNLLKRIEFKYDFFYRNIFLPVNSSDAERFFLKKVKYIGTENDDFEYSFEYDDPEVLPNRKSYAIDMKGYYNGKIGNNSLMPPLTVYYGERLNSNNYADRFPDFEYARKGTLRKVVYPTKGYTVFDYEPNPAKKKKIVTINGDVFVNSLIGQDLYGTPTRYNLEIPYIYTNNFGTDTVFKNPVNIKQEIKIKLKVNTINNSPNHNMGVRLTIQDLTNNTEVVESTSTEKIFAYNLEKNHNYKFKVEILIPYHYSSEYSAWGTFSFDYVEDYIDTDGLGIRLKRRTDYSDDNTVANIERYYYTAINNVGNEIKDEIIFLPKWYLNVTPGARTSTGDSFDMSNFIFFSEDIGVHRNGLNHMESFPIITTSYGGDNFEKGGVERQYSFMPNQSATRFSTLADGFTSSCEPVNNGVENVFSIARNSAQCFEIGDRSTFNGELIFEKFYEKLNNNLYKTKEVYYMYDFNVVEHLNFVHKKLHSVSGTEHALFCDCSVSGPVVNGVSEFCSGYYYDIFVEKRLEKIETKNYFDKILLQNDYTFCNPFDIEIFDGLYKNYYCDASNDVNENAQLNYRKIIHEKSFTYGNLRGMPIEITESTSDSGILKKQVLTYVDQNSNLLNLSNNEIIAYQEMINKNIISSPIQVQEFRNSELLNTNRVIYELVNGVPCISKIQNSKGNSLTMHPLEDILICYEYDNFGNPTLVSKDGVIFTRFVYNSNYQVIAKIENYTSGSIPTSFSNCNLQSQFPSCLVSTYEYDIITGRLVSVTDQKCNTISYHYDDLGRLDHIKDQDGNILSENEYHYRPQN